MAVHETVAVPEPAVLLGEIGPQLRPLGKVSVRETAPVKPPSAVTVMVEVCDWPTFVGLGEEP